MGTKPRMTQRTTQRASLGREGSPTSAKRIARLAEEMKADSPKGYQAVKDAASSGPAMRARNMAKAQSAAEGFVERQRTVGRIGTIAQSAGRKVTSIAKGVAKGLLSPAGAGEAAALDVAARTARPAREKMQERGVQKVEKAAPKTAAAMRKARVTKA